MQSGKVFAIGALVTALSGCDAISKLSGPEPFFGIEFHWGPDELEDAGFECGMNEITDNSEFQCQKTFGLERAMGGTPLFLEHEVEDVRIYFEDNSRKISAIAIELVPKSPDALSQIKAALNQHYTRSAGAGDLDSSHTIYLHWLRADDVTIRLAYRKPDPLLFDEAVRVLGMILE